MATSKRSTKRISVEYVTHTGDAHVMHVTGTIGREYAPVPLAQLLEAAPAMLDALRALLVACAMDGPDQIIVDQAKAAIRRATVAA